MIESKKDIEALIKKKTKEAEEILYRLKGEIAKLADAGGVEAYWGEYGSGETYYPAGTDVEANYLESVCYDYDIPIDEEGKLLQGAWVSSSSMC